MANEGGLRIGSFAGAAIVVDPTILILALFVLANSGEGGLLGAFSFLAALVVAVLLHEFGHAGVAALLKLPSKRIVLTFFGGHVDFAWPPKSRWQDIVVSAAGPIANLLVYFIVVVLAASLNDLPNVAYLFMAQLAEVSLLLGVFNLLPGFPLDGGRILRAFLNYFMSLDRARLIAGAIGLLIALALVGYSVLQGLWWNVMVGLFLGLGAWSEARSANAALKRGTPSEPSASAG